MPLTFIKDGQIIPPEFDLPEVNATLEWREGQYWLHSQEAKERPIGIAVDEILHRHQEFFRKSSVQKELFARALGIKGGFRPRILDLSAGLLGDSLLFLAAGCTVTAIERHPLVGFLIESSLRNAEHPSLKRLQFQKGNAEEFLSPSLDYDVIYFDPMFEDANLKAAPKKEMRIFRELLQGDTDAESVLTKALSSGVKRVVVKRPRLSGELLDRKPLRMTGKSTRYDVYFP